MQHEMDACRLVNGWLCYWWGCNISIVAAVTGIYRRHNTLVTRRDKWRRYMCCVVSAEEQRVKHTKHCSVIHLSCLWWVVKFSFLPCFPENKQIPDSFLNERYFVCRINLISINARNFCLFLSFIICLSIRIQLTLKREIDRQRERRGKNGW